jgi:hypothetical protein
MQQHGADEHQRHHREQAAPLLVDAGPAGQRLEHVGQQEALRQVGGCHDEQQRGRGGDRAPDTHRVAQDASHDVHPGSCPCSALGMPDI